jgi:hypothetical protein
MRSHTQSTRRLFHPRDEGGEQNVPAPPRSLLLSRLVHPHMRPSSSPIRSLQVAHREFRNPSPYADIRECVRKPQMCAQKRKPFPNTTSLYGGFLFCSHISFSSHIYPKQNKHQGTLPMHTVIRTRAPRKNHKNPSITWRGRGEAGIGRRLKTTPNHPCSHPAPLVSTSNRHTP